MGGVSTYSATPIRVDNPYTISNLWHNCKVNTGIYDNSYVLNMYVYAKNSISNYNTITEIPSGHLPSDLNTSLAQNWYSAFSNCYRLTSFPDPFYNTSNATNICRIFGECSRIITVPNFDTNNVTDMRQMFYMCSRIITVPNFNTGKVTDMSWMFSYCYNLTTVPNFDTSNVTNMYYMFANCYNLTTVPNFDTSNVTNMQQVFYGCNNLTTSPNFDTSKVTNMHSTFSSCYNLITIPTFDTSNMTNISFMYSRCYNIRGDLYIESNNVIDATSLFSNASDYTKNIYCHANSITYNTIYNAMRNTYNSNWNAYLKTMEDTIAEIEWNGPGIYRFPTNKIALNIQNNIEAIIEVTPYTDYNLVYNMFARAPESFYIECANSNKTWGGFVNSTIGASFRFFKDITNMTANVVDII